MKFEFIYTMTGEDYIALNKMRNTMFYHKRNKVMQAAYALLGVLFAGLGVTFFQRGTVGTGVFVLVVGLIFLSRLYTLGRLGKRRAERMAAAGAGEQTVQLEEDGVRVKDSTAEGFVRYGDFTDLWHMDDRYCLVFGELHTLLIPERALTQGDSADLRAFLEEKLEQETKELE